MKLMKTIGIILLVVGIVMTSITGFSIITKDKVIDIGSVEVQKEKRTPIYWSPVTGGILAAAGLVITVIGSKKSPKQNA